LIPLIQQPDVWEPVEPALTDGEGLKQLADFLTQDGIVLVHPNIVEQTPGFFLALQRASHRLQTQRHQPTIRIRFTPASPETLQRVRGLWDALGLDQLNMGFYVTMPTQDQEEAALAIGPGEWQQQVPRARARILYEPTDDKHSIRSPAQALLTGVDSWNSAPKNKVATPEEMISIEPSVIPSAQRGPVQDYQALISG